MKRLDKIKAYTLWLILSLALGFIGGVCGAAFSKSVELVTNIRNEHSFLIYLLPLGGLVSVTIYKLLQINGANTLSVFNASKNNTPLPHGLSVAIFGGGVLSHLFGASVGREGAALQIGGGVASVLSHLFRLDDKSRRVMLLCGMAALFSALFGTPLAAAVFVIEIIMTRLCFTSIIPIFISSLTAFKVAAILGTHAERFNIGDIPYFSLPIILKTAIIIIACVIVCLVWCKGLHLAEHIAKKLLKNDFLRIAVGGIIIIVLTLLISSNDYNGGGVDVIAHVFDGSVKYEAFALKLLFTIICVSAGYKGGEIVPTLFIGATLGGALALILNLPIGFGAAIGIAVLFSASTKCPIATILLCCEMFGFGSILFTTITAIISVILSHFYKGIYNNSNHIITYTLNKFKKDSR
ncbi:MAG: chloride channel protein [Clostridia bacterium]|nr:chloride channel protein [Clostridia bacterium]